MNRSSGLFLSDQSDSLCVVCDDEAMRITCRWAKPEAFNELRIRRDCAIDFIDFGRSLVVLSKGRHLGCLTATGGSAFKICEIGKQGVSIAGVAVTSTLWGKDCFVAFES